MTLVKEQLGRLFRRTITIDIGTTTLGFVVGERDFLNSKYKGKWAFVAKKQPEVSGLKIAERRHQGKGEFWLNGPNRILTEGRLGLSIHLDVDEGFHFN